jgi:hypothetical protein
MKKEWTRRAKGRGTCRRGYRLLDVLSKSAYSSHPAHFADGRVADTAAKAHPESRYFVPRDHNGYNEGIMSRFVYFDYRGEFPPSITGTVSPVLYRYIVEVSKKDCDGGDRDPEEQRRVARSLLHMSLGHDKTELVVSSPTQAEIEQKHFDTITKAEIYSTWDGRVYRVVRGLDVWE